MARLEGIDRRTKVADWEGGTIGDEEAIKLLETPDIEKRNKAFCEYQNRALSFGASEEQLQENIAECEKNLNSKE